MDIILPYHCKSYLSVPNWGSGDSSLVYILSYFFPILVKIAILTTGDSSDSWRSIQQLFFSTKHKCFDSIYSSGALGKVILHKNKQVNERG